MEKSRQAGRRWRLLRASAITVLLLLAAAALAAWLGLRASLPQLDGVRQARGLAGAVTVLRDANGVPTLSAANRADLAYATGFLHGQERFFQMDLMRRSGAGELAELFGPKALPLDRSHRLHRFRARAATLLAAMDGGERGFLERYAAGVNDGVQALGARPFEYALTGSAPRPWQPADSLLVVFAMYFDLQSMQQTRELARGWMAEHSDAAQRAFLLPAATSWDAPLDADAVALAPAPLPAAAPAWWGAPAPSNTPALAALDTHEAFADAVGSNNWVIAGSRSASGRAILSNDMHLGLQLPNTWYRIVMQYPQADGRQRRLVGLTLPGAPPVLTVGSNGRVAWGYTNAYGDFLDLVAVEKDGALPVTTHAETIRIKGAPAETLQVRETALGPLLTVAGRDYAVHWIAHQPGAVNMRHRALEESDTLEQALAIAATIGIPAQNFVAGDADGHIGWTITGLLPRRAAPTTPGDGLDASFPIVVGSAVRSWDGVLAPSEYPKLIDPAGGQLATANSRQLAGPQAALIGDGGFDLGARARQIGGDLKALGARTDVAGVYGVTLDDRAVFIAPWRQRALAVLDAAALKDHPQRARYAQLLRDSWSGRASADAVGYRLARGFMWTLFEQAYGSANGAMAALDPKADAHAASSRWPVVMARLLDEQPAGWLPPGVASWRDFQLAAIDRQIAALAASGQSLESASWGQRNTATIGHPIAMALPLLKRFLSAPADRLPGDANMPRVAGPKFGQSERLTVSPGREEEGVFNMPGGQSGHPLSANFLQGHADWVAGRPMPLMPGPAVHTLRFEPAR